MSDDTWEARQNADLEARIVRRMEASARRDRLESMARAIVSGSSACHVYLMDRLGAGAIVDAAEGLLAEIDRRCEARDDG